ncbi:MAG: hypothetical protein OJF52_001706 [Nitrospira sp.]|nr:MAG: hypothetical protein OJF52_001706 [Nitrospira sp.]
MKCIFHTSRLLPPTRSFLFRISSFAREEQGDVTRSHHEAGGYLNIPLPLLRLGSGLR